MSEKISGYLLLFLGLAVIFWSVFNVSRVFLAAKPAPAVISISSPSFSLPLSGLGLPASQGSPSLGLKLFSDEDLNEIINLVICLLFSGFLVSAGAKVASLGIQLLKIGPSVKIETKA